MRTWQASGGPRDYHRVVARRGRRGEGTVYYSRTDRRWVARFPLGVVKGRRAAKRVKCRSERQARAELEQLRRVYGAGGDPATQTLDEYLADWLRAHGRSVEPSTLRSYRGHVDKHIAPLLGGIPVIRLRPSDVRRLIDELERKGKSPATIRLVVTTLRIALGAAVLEGSIPINAAARIKLPKVDREPVRALTEDEADVIRDAVRGWWLGPIVRVLLGSGMRLGEAIGLDQRDLHLADGYVSVRHSKTDPRTVPISADAADAIRLALRDAARLGPNEPVFWSPKRRRDGHRGRLQGSSVSHALPRLLADSGLGHFHPHLLRHGAASIMLKRGHSIRVIAEQLGHRNPATTARIYAHVGMDSQRAAVAALEPRQKDVESR